RERGDDVLIIAKALLSKYAEELHSPVQGFTPQALAAIRKSNWPGNIRQLENRLKKALVLCDRTLLGIEDLELDQAGESSILPLEKAKEEFQRKYVLEVLERNNGNRTQTRSDLEYDRVLEALAGRCVSEMGRALARALPFATTRVETRRLLEEAREAT